MPYTHTILGTIIPGCSNNEPGIVLLCLDMSDPRRVKRVKDIFHAFISVRLRRIYSFLKFTTHSAQRHTISISMAHGGPKPEAWGMGHMSQSCSKHYFVFGKHSSDSNDNAGDNGDNNIQRRRWRFINAYHFFSRWCGTSHSIQVCAWAYHTAIDP